eukprot:symbB.v1.2.002519.t1/scaffold134.1/size305535/3
MTCGPWRDEARTQRVELTKRVVSFGRRSAWQEAVDLLKHGKKTGYDVAMCSAVVAACGKGTTSSQNAWRSAVEVCFNMGILRVVPNVSSYSSVMTACRGVATWPVALGEAARSAPSVLVQRRSQRCVAIGSM